MRKKKGTGGLITRILAENPKDYFPLDKKICFLGLNALSKSEETIVNYLTKNNSSKIIVDVDEFYTINKDHEASCFITHSKNSGYYHAASPKLSKNELEPYLTLNLIFG